MTRGDRNGSADTLPGAALPSGQSINDKLLEAILSRNEDAIVVTSPGGAITHWNPAAERLLGYAAEEIIGRHSRIILPQAWWCYWDERLAELRRGTTVICDSVRRHKDGSSVDVHATTSGVFGSDGSFLGYFNVFKDLRAKKDQDAANAFLAAIVRGSPDAIASTDIDLNVRTWNAAAETMLGYSFSDVVGQHVGRYIPEIDLGGRGETFPTKVQRFETALARRDGREIPASIVASPLLNAAGVPTGWSITCRDVTERKRREEHSRFIMRELSHRAKNLLAVIMAMFRNSAETTPSLADFEADFGMRLKGLAKSHDLLVHGGWVGASLHALIAVQVQPFVGGTGRLTFSGPDGRLLPAAIQSVGLAVHELATNAAKYGALASSAGRIDVETSVEAGGLRLTWIETGGPPVTRPAQSGFGMAVIEDMVADTMGSGADIEFRPVGIRWSVLIPESLIVCNGANGGSLHDPVRQAIPTA